MNQEERFDELTRELAASPLSRGRMLRLLGGAVLGSALGGWGLALTSGDAGAKKKKKKKKEDLPTVESLAAARAKLEAGATDVDLSPGGYFRYRRTFNGTFVTSEELLEGGKPVLTWQHMLFSSKGYGDADRDGFSESVIEVWRGQTRTGEQLTITNYSPKTRALVRRKTYKRTGPDTIHALIERDDGSGNLVEEAEFDTTPIQVLTTEHLAEPNGQAQAQLAALSGTGCTAAQEKEIRDRLDEAMVEGIRCTRDKGIPELGTKVVGLTARKVIVNCESDPSDDRVASLDWWDGAVGGSELEITVNLSKYSGYVPETQRGVLWHETMHAHFGSHDFFPSARHFESDQTYACQSLCFPNSMKSEYLTKCSCARCLGTDKCDKRCATFGNCDADMGSGISVKCTCPPPKTEECGGQCLAPCPKDEARNPAYGCKCTKCLSQMSTCTQGDVCCDGYECCTASHGIGCCTGIDRPICYRWGTSSNYNAACVPPPI